MLGASSLAAVTAPPVVAAPMRSLFVLGDSWAAGLYADPQRALGQVAAAGLRWQAVVDAVSGTGYVTGAAQSTSYPDRAASILAGTPADIAVVQGGSNDRGVPPADLAAAARRTLAILDARLPSARLVMLGPGPDPEPVTAEQRAVDALLADVAARERIPYISMLREGWITPGGAADVLDPITHHPTVEGQARLGLLLEESLRRLFPTVTEDHRAGGGRRRRPRGTGTT
jgi:lysophospholipase L1-like esterase